jgi:hypothetical protein
MGLVTHALMYIHAVAILREFSEIFYNSSNVIKSKFSTMN